MIDPRARRVSAPVPPAKDASREAGFTLLEVLIATAIIGLASAVVVLNLAPAGDQAGRAAETVAANLNTLKRQAGSVGQPVRVSLTDQGLSAEVWTPDGWAAVSGASDLTGQGVGTLRLETGQPLLLDPLWSQTAGAVLIGEDRALWRIATDEAGHFVAARVEVR